MKRLIPQRSWMAERGGSAWNRMYGIDPQLDISQEDIKSLEKRVFAFAGDAAGAPRVAGPPVRVLLFPQLPGVLLIIGGFLAVVLWGLPTWSLAMTLPMGTVLMIAGWHWIARRHFGAIVRRELRALGYALCVDCGYNLQGGGNEHQRCPECGAAVLPTPRAAVNPPSIR